MHYTVPEGKILLIDRLIVFIEDNGNFSAGGYGNLAELSNGIIDGTTKDGVFTHSGDVAITSVGDWAALGHDLNYQSFGTSPNFLTIRYTFTNEGAPLMIPSGQSFTIRCNDDLTGLLHTDSELAEFSAQPKELTWRIH